MKCWFKRDPRGEWAPGLIVGYVSPASVVVKVDKRGELLALPLDRVSCGDNKPEEGHEHYKDPRYPDVVTPPEAPKPFTALTADSLRKAGGK